MGIMNSGIAQYETISSRLAFFDDRSSIHELASDAEYLIVHFMLQLQYRIEIPRYLDLTDNKSPLLQVVVLELKILYTMYDLYVAQISHQKDTMHT